MFRRFWKLITLTISIWNDANASRMSAALTYYTMLSLAPTLMIAVAIAGYVYDSKQAQNEIVEQVSLVTTPEIASTVGGLIKDVATPGSGAVAGLISLSVLIFAASGVFTQLYDTFNDIWEVSLEGKGILFTIQKRLVGVAMVLIVGLMLIGVLVLDSAVTFLNELVAGSYPQLENWLLLADQSVSFLLMPVVFAMMFWFLPSTKVHWGDIWPAAVLTAAMIAASRYLITLYLKFSTTSEVYAASSSLVVLLIWVYMTGLVVFLGAAFSYAWAQVYGSRSEFAKPDPNAESEGDQATQVGKAAKTEADSEPEPESSAPMAPIANPKQQLPEVVIVQKGNLQKGNSVQPETAAQNIKAVNPVSQEPELEIKNPLPPPLVPERRPQ